MVATISNSTQQPGSAFLKSFRLRHFVQIASEKPFNFHSGLWLLWSHIIMDQTWNKYEDREVDICLEKYILPSKRQLLVFLLAANFELDRITSYKTQLGCQVSVKIVAFKVASFETNFFRTADTWLRQLKFWWIAHVDVWRLHCDVLPFIYWLTLLVVFAQLLVSVGLEDYHLIGVWDWRKGRVLATVRGHTDRVSS